MSVSPVDFVKKRRDRVLATILSYKETNVDRYLPQAERENLRRVILNNVNDFNDLVLDMLKATAEPQVEMNQLYLDAIKSLGRIEAKLEELE